MEQEDLGPEEMREILITEGGVKAISGGLTDMRDLYAAAGDGNSQAQLALDTFHTQVKMEIGKCVALLGGIDALVFTGGTGAKGAPSREAICKGLECMGLRLDIERNKAQNPAWISQDGSPAAILVIPTNEEIIVARETVRVLEEARAS